MEQRDIYGRPAASAVPAKDLDVEAAIRFSRVPTAIFAVAAIAIAGVAPGIFLGPMGGEGA